MERGPASDSPNRRPCRRKRSTSALELLPGPGRVTVSNARAGVEFWDFAITNEGFRVGYYHKPMTLDRVPGLVSVY